MRKAGLIVGILCILTVSGCASMWKVMGVATVASVNDQDSRLNDLKTVVDGMASKMDDTASQQSARLDELKKEIDDLSAKEDNIQLNSAQIEKIATLVSELQGKIDGLPQATLKKLAEILSRAVIEQAKAAQ